MTSLRTPLRNLADVEALEAVPIEARLERPVSSYAAIARQAAATPGAPALTFVPTGDPADGETRFDYATLLQRITQAANVFAGLGGLLVVRAFRLAPVSILAPFQYFEIISATILGFLLFGDFPTASKWLGVVIIVGSGLFIIWRERRATAAVH